MTLKDDNWKSSRQSILLKYDKNGDGVYDTDEVNGIVDDYMATIQKNAVLVDTNHAMKKLLTFSGIMIFILSLSNLGTAVLAAYLAKEISVASDGTLMTADGKNTALKTESKAQVLTLGKSFSDSAEMVDTPGGTHSLDKDGQEFGNNDNRRTCFPGDEVVKLYDDFKAGATTAKVTIVEKVLQGDSPSEYTYTITGNAARSLLPGTSAADPDDGIINWRYGFFSDNANIVFEYHSDCTKKEGYHFKFYSSATVTFDDAPCGTC